MIDCIHIPFTKKHPEIVQMPNLLVYLVPDTVQGSCDDLFNVSLDCNAIHHVVHVCVHVCVCIYAIHVCTCMCMCVCVRHLRLLYT